MIREGYCLKFNIFIFNSAQPFRIRTNTECFVILVLVCVLANMATSFRVVNLEELVVRFYTVHSGHVAAICDRHFQEGKIGSCMHIRTNVIIKHLLQGEHLIMFFHVGRVGRRLCKHTQVRVPVIFCFGHGTSTVGQIDINMVEDFFLRPEVDPQVVNVPESERCNFIFFSVTEFWVLLL